MFGKLYKLFRAAHGIARIGASVLAGTMVVASAGYVGERIFSSPAAPVAAGEEGPEAFTPAPVPVPSLARFPASPFAARPTARGASSASRDDSAATLSGVEASSAGASSQPVFDGGTTPPPPDNLPAIDASNGSVAAGNDSHAPSTSAEASTATSTSSSLASPNGDTGAYFARGGATSSATSTTTATVSINGTLYWDYEHRWDNDTWW